jgi:hypothetical protein
MAHGMSSKALKDTHTNPTLEDCCRLDWDGTSNRSDIKAEDKRNVREKEHALESPRNFDPFGRQWKFKIPINTMVSSSTK